MGSVEELVLILICASGRLGRVAYQAPGGCHLLLVLPVPFVEQVAFSDRQCYRTILDFGHSCPDVCAQDCRLGKDRLSCANRLLGTEFVVWALLALVGCLWPRWLRLLQSRNHCGHELLTKAHEVASLYEHTQRRKSFPLLTPRRIHTLKPKHKSVERQRQKVSSSVC